MAKVLHDALTIEQGFMTTIHAYTADQRLQDMPHDDLRRARAAALNLIPTSTGAARAIGVVMPELEGQGRRDVDAGAGAGRLRRRSGRLGLEGNQRRRGQRPSRRPQSGPLEGLLGYSDEPLVSQDIVGSAYSCTFDSQLTMVNGRMVKIFGWYDNEWGYSCRLVDLVSKMGASLPKTEAAATA